MKIHKILLNNFRGFPGPRNYEFHLEGRNLLLFGENGSGKSSLYRALVELFQPGTPLKPFSEFRHIFAADLGGRPLDTGLVRVEFESALGETVIAEWSETQDRTPLLRGVSTEMDLTARSLGCLDYRAMLETNFVHRSGGVNLFPLIVRNLLRHAPVMGGGSQRLTLGHLWTLARSSIPKSHRGWKWKPRVNSAAGNWNASFAPLIEDLTTGTNRFLQYFDTSGITVALRPADLIYSTSNRKLEGQAVWLDVSLHGKPLPEPQHFLNEARLSALALALFLAGYELSIPPPLAGGTDYARVLVLDDVLIGLDYSNRLPLLRLLADHFQDWQILLFTHDSVWYELAKEFTETSEQWKYTQILGIQDGGPGVGYPRLHDPKGDIIVSKEHFAAGDRKASAGYARSAFESKLRSFCSKRGIPVPFRSNPKEVKADALWTATKLKNTGLLAAGKPAIIDAGLVNQIEAVRSVVLNSFNHALPTTLTSSELQSAIQAVETFCQIPNS